MTKKPNDAVGPSEAPLWVLILGAFFLTLSFIFCMLLAYRGAVSSPLLPGNERMINIVVSLGIATGSALLGGYAKATGQVQIFGNKSPTTFGVGGGVAVFFIGLLLLSFLNRPVIIPVPDPFRAKIIHESGNVSDLVSSFLRPRLNTETRETLLKEAIKLYDILMQYPDEKLAADLLVEKYVAMASVMSVAGVLSDELNDDPTRILRFANLGRGAAIYGRGFVSDLLKADGEQYHKAKEWVIDQRKDDRLLYFASLCSALDMKYSTSDESRLIAKDAAKRFWQDMKTRETPDQDVLRDALDLPKS